MILRNLSLLTRSAAASPGAPAGHLQRSWPAAAQTKFISVSPGAARRFLPPTLTPVGSVKPRGTGAHYYGRVGRSASVCLARERGRPADHCGCGTQGGSSEQYSPEYCTGTVIRYRPTAGHAQADAGTDEDLESDCVSVCSATRGGCLSVCDGCSCMREKGDARGSKIRLAALAEFSTPRPTPPLRRKCVEERGRKPRRTPPPKRRRTCQHRSRCMALALTPPTSLPWEWRLLLEGIDKVSTLWRCVLSSSFSRHTMAFIE